MSFSIVTIALNAADDLALTLESIVQQDFIDFELIFVDGGSWDNTASIIDNYGSNIDKIVRIEDAGIFYAMNEATKYCNKEYTLFMNAKDRFFSSNVLSKVWEAKQNDPDLIFGDHIYVNGRVEAFTKARDFSVTRNMLRDGDVNHRWHSGFPCHQSTFTRTSLLKTLHYDTRLEICADHDFLIRAYDDGAEFQYIDEVVCHYMGGGYSALRWERCKAEFAFVYRRYSSDPIAVDRLFYNDQPSPFSPQTLRTGLLLSYMYPREGPYPDAGIPRAINWLPARGIDIQSPSPDRSLGLTLEGFNHLPEQVLSAIIAGRKIGTITVPSGFFKVSIGFSEIVPPRSALQIVPSRYGSLAGGDSRFVSFALSAFQFDTVNDEKLKPLRPGSAVYFKSSNADDVRSMLVSGWSHLEGNHIWSVGPQTYIQINASSLAQFVRIRMTGNPFVTEADQSVDIALNGHDLGRFQLVDDKGLVLNLKSDGWIVGTSNLISLRPVAIASPPDDPRMLGFCLHAVEVYGDGANPNELPVTDYSLQVPI